MRDGNFTFADLIAPLKPQAFFAQSWEKTPLHINRSPSPIYHALITAGNVQTAIASGGLRHPAIQLAKGGAFFPPETFCRNIRSGDDVFSGVPDLERVQSEYQAGATISLPGFHRSWGPLSTLVNSIQTEFDHAVHTNVYLTPGKSAGFTPHYDTHDVFILQISGVKHWQIYAPSIPLPHRSQPFSPQSFRASNLILEVELRPGDLLYLPRGFVHSTHTSDEASMHVTLGVTVYTWVDLAAEWLQSAKNNPRFRRALPTGFAGGADQITRLKAEMGDLLAQLQAAEMDPLIDSFLKRVRASTGKPSEEFHFAVAAIGPLDRLRVLGAGKYVIKDTERGMILTFLSKSLTLPIQMRPTLEAIGRLPSFCSEELPSHLGDDAKLTLIRHLYKEGLLVLAT